MSPFWIKTLHPFVPLLSSTLDPKWACSSPAAMAFPTQETIDVWNNGEDGSGTIGQVLDWAQTSDELRAALLVALECNHTEHYRNLSMLSEAEIEEIIGECNVNDRPLSRLNKSKVRLIFQAIKCAAGTAAQPAPGTPPAPVVISTPAELTAGSANAVALNGVTTQVGAVIVPLASNDLVKQVHATYKRKTGGPMARDVEPTRHQVSAFDALIKEDVELNVDFAVWVQYGDRLLKKRAIDGWKMGANGVWIPIQIYGPPTFGDWKKSYKIFRSTSLGFDAIDTEWLDRYPDIIGDFVDKYPVECWALIYQSEARTRGEHLVRIRRRLEMEYDDAQKRGEAHEFDPKRPWNMTFKTLVLGEKDWWFEQFKEPCGYIYTKTEAPTTRVEGDQPVSAGSTRPPAASTQSPASAPPQVVHQPPVHQPAAGGATHKTHNNKNTELCRGFQTGACTDKVGNRCARNKALVHQCSICLDNRHGAHECPKGNGMPPKSRGTKRRRP